MLIADASLLANLIVPGLDRASAEAVRDIDADWRAPSLWHYELRNVLLKYIRADTIEEDGAGELMTRAVDLMGQPEADAPSSYVLATAKKFGISSYDAEYLAIALLLNVPLITFDKKLARSSPDIAMHPDDYLSRS